MIPHRTYRGRISDGISPITAEFYEVLAMMGVYREQLKNPRAIQHAAHGVGRRISIIRVNLVHLLRMSARTGQGPLHGDPGHELDTHLNSFYIHLHGLLDNLAWMIAHELSLFGGVSEDEFSDRRKVGLFKNEFQIELNDVATTEFLQSKNDWHTSTKDWRDPIAHRIPLYAIPCVFSKEEAAEFERLSHLALEALKAGDAELSDSYHTAKMKLGTYHPIFAHETNGHPTSIKEQVESDARNLLDVIWHFIEHDWTRE